MLTLILLVLTLFKMGLFGTDHGWRGGRKAPLPKICLSKEDPKNNNNNKSRDTHPDTC